MYLIFDTETDGLNIVLSQPFLFPYGIADKNLNLIKIKLAKSDKDIKEFIKDFKQCDTIVGHNIKFDLHMLLNYGVTLDELKNKNYIDTQVLARLAVSHDIQTDSSFQTGLKRLAVRYLGVDSAEEERKLRAELSRLVMEHKANMLEYFKSLNLWPDQTRTEDTSMINSIYNSWFKVFHLYPELDQPRKDFLTINPEPNYKDIYNVEQYALTDIKLTHGLFRLWYPEAVRKDQVPTLLRVSKAVIPLLLMERQGLTVDIDKLLRDRESLLKEWDKTKIIDPRTGEELSVGQHAKLKELYEYESGLKLTSADKETRKKIEAMSPAAQAANYLAQMGKYLNSYMNRLLERSVEINGEYKIFTQYNLGGTVTGRLSSDFQQFPRDPLMLKDGTEINIRSWFIVPKDYEYMFFYDYAQMELRLQCEWTGIVLGEPDLNLARAFTPFKCSKIGDKYYLNENLQMEWKPTDLHSLTAKNAFPDIDESHPDWSHYRDLGKRTNFAVNYGASAAAVARALSVDFKTATNLVEGYKKAFPGAVAFAQWVRRRVYSVDNIPNLLLRRYYSRNAHQLQNWLVQGSGADILLEKMKEIYDYIADKPHWQFMISVHDEVGLVVSNPKQEEIETIKNILTYRLSSVDIIADVEYSDTTWSNKKEWKHAN